MAEPVDPPLSPWAERFGVSDSYPWKGENKSGFHPTYPDINVRFPDSLSPEAYVALNMGVPLPVPSDPDLDRLFLDETYQKNKLSGYFTWQAALFSAIGNNEPVNTTVDETSWLPLFAKKRWYNLDRRMNDSWRGTLDSGFAADATWSVDDPVFWENLSPAIQLADRLVRASIQHPFMDAILGVTVADLYPNNPQAEGLSRPPLLARNNTPPLQSEQQLLDTLGRFAEKVIITFMPPGMPGDMGSSYGITTSMEDPNLKGKCNGYDFAATMLNCRLIWPLLDRNGTSSSKAEAALIFAVTLAHEMIHVIYRVRNMLAPKGEIHRDEPFYAPPGTRPENSAWVSELGISWEQSIIGGALSECPKKRGNTGGFFTYSVDVPNWNVYQSYQSAVNVASHEEDTWNGYAVPAFVAQLYSSDEFWQTHFTKYGLPALIIPKLLKSKLDRADIGDPEICQLEYAVPEFRSRLEGLGENFKNRKSQWECLRPWYSDKQTEWEDTPYSRVWLRNLAGRFRAAHRQGDEWAGSECCKPLGAYEQWGDTYTSEGFLLDQDGDWLDQAVGYLMLLTMPIRSARETKKIPWFPRNEFKPSAAALADAAANSSKPFEVEVAGGNGDWDEMHLEPRNVPFTPNDPNKLMGNRASLIALLRDEITNRQRMYWVPDPVFQELMAMFNNVERDAPKHQTSGQWLSDQIKFVLPPWQREQAKTNIGYAPSSVYSSSPVPSNLSVYEPYNHSAQPQQYVPGAASSPRSGSAGGFDPRTPPRPASDPGWPSRNLSPPSPNLGTPRSPASARSARRRVAHSGRRAATTIDTVYYTIGEVGNHISTGDLWVIADDGAHGYDVYHATDVVEEMWADDHVAFSLDDHCDRTLLGLKARPQLQRNLEGQARLMGKLIMPMRRHEIAERDGRHGKPFWISIGNDVFDISNFPFESENQRRLMAICPGGNPWNAIVKDGTIDYDQLFTDLKPYRCAVVASQTPDKGPGPDDEFLFTRQEVACHVYPETTMYTIIRGQVYNLTGYMDYHPGGEKILRQWAGRDSTSEFEKYHADADRCLRDYDYLRVGRLVAEKSVERLTRNEIALNGHVYGLGGIGSGRRAQEFVREVDRLGLRGRDVTSVLNDGYMIPSEALLLLPERPDLITAKLTVPLAEIDLATLRAHDGSHMQLPDGMRVPRRRVEADPQMPIWVAYGGLVYDMTAASKWGPEDVKAQLNGHDRHLYRGAVVPPSALATRLQQDYGCRVIGRLVGNLRRPRDEEGGWGGDLDGRAHQRPRLY